MLKPSVTIVQSQHSADGSERRLSLPHDFMVSETSSQNGTSIAPQKKQQQQSGGAPHVQYALQPQQQHSNTQVRSVTSAMDLMSTSSLSSTFFPPPQQTDLFKSSSHHTSHTAAAGDLLSMSRRAFEPPLGMQKSVSGKKRSSTITEDPGNDVRMDGMNFVGPQSITQQQNNVQTHHVFATPTDTSTFHNNGFNSTATTKLCNIVSTSTFSSQGGADESYQQHRTIRRCQRPDSFEMMEDD